MSSSRATASRSRRTWLWTCGGFAATFVLSCLVLAAIALILRSSRPTARELYSGAPDRVAGQSVSEALVDAGVQGASVVVIPIQGRPGQIAILTLDESRGYRGFSAGGSENLHTVVTNIVSANRTGNHHIEQLSIDYRDTSGQSSLAFTTTMARAEAYSDGSISQQEFMGQIDFNLVETLRYLGVDEILREAQE